MALNERQATHLAWALGAVRQLRELKTIFVGGRGKGTPKRFEMTMGGFSTTSPHITLSSVNDYIISFGGGKDSPLSVAVKNKEIHDEVADLLYHSHLHLIDIIGDDLRRQIAELGGDPGLPFQSPKEGLRHSGEL